ncbi:hypothetical protein Tco_1209811 [Tanacetum coccineum]
MNNHTNKHYLVGFVVAAKLQPLVVVVRRCGGSSGGWSGGDGDDMVSVDGDSGGTRGGVEVARGGEWGSRSSRSEEDLHRVRTFGKQYPQNKVQQMRGARGRAYAIDGGILGRLAGTSLDRGVLVDTTVMLKVVLDTEAGGETGGKFFLVFRDLRSFVSNV